MKTVSRRGFLKAAALGAPVTVVGRSKEECKGRQGI